jgi:hypothetical protein
MAEIKKGVVTQVIEGGGAVIRPYGAGSALTPELAGLSFVQPHPTIAVGDSVAFVLFEDGTGFIIDKVQ